MGRILISEEEKRHILGMHIDKGYNSIVNEQAAASTTQQGTTATNTTQNSPIDVNLAIFDKYIPSNAQRDRYITYVKIGDKTEQDIERMKNDPFIEAAGNIINRLESNVELDKKTLPPTDDKSWEQWHINKGIVVKSPFNWFPDKAAEAYSAAVSAYNWDSIRQTLGIFKQFATQYPNETAYSPNFKTYMTQKNLSRAAVDLAYKVGQIVGLIGPNKDLTPLRNLS